MAHNDRSQLALQRLLESMQPRVKIYCKQNVNQPIGFGSRLGLPLCLRYSIREVGCRGVFSSGTSAAAVLSSAAARLLREDRAHVWDSTLILCSSRNIGLSDPPGDALGENMPNTMANSDGAAGEDLGRAKGKDRFGHMATAVADVGTGEDLGSNNSVGQRGDVAASVTDNLMLSPEDREQRRGIRKMREKPYETLLLRLAGGYVRNGLEVMDTGDQQRGRGLFTQLEITRSRTFLCEYGGELLEGDAIPLREAEYQKNPDVWGSYMFYYRRDGHAFAIDAGRTTDFIARYANHSRIAPNSEIRSVVDAANKVRLYLRTLDKPISAGTEIVYDYGDRERQTVQANPWLRYT